MFEHYINKLPFYYLVNINHFGYKKNTTAYYSFDVRNLFLCSKKEVFNCTS
jgi:hypothetical protein